MFVRSLSVLVFGLIFVPKCFCFQTLGLDTLTYVRAVERTAQNLEDDVSADTAVVREDGSVYLGMSDEQTAALAERRRLLDEQRKYALEAYWAERGIRLHLRHTRP